MTDPVIAPVAEPKKKPEKIIFKKEDTSSKISIKRLNRKTKVTGKAKANEQINELVRKEEEEVLSDEEKKTGNIRNKSGMDLSKYFNGNITANLRN